MAGQEMDEQVVVKGKLSENDYEAIIENLNQKLEETGRSEAITGVDVKFFANGNNCELCFKNQGNDCTAHEFLECFTEFLKDKNIAGTTEYFKVNATDPFGTYYGIVSKNGAEWADVSKVINAELEAMISLKQSEEMELKADKVREQSFSFFQITGKTEATEKDIRYVLQGIDPSEELYITVRNGYFSLEAEDITGRFAEDIVKKIQDLTEEFENSREEYFAYGSGEESFAFPIKRDSTPFNMENWDEKVALGKVIDQLDDCLNLRRNVPVEVLPNDGFWLTVLEKDASFSDELPYALQHDKDFLNEAFERNIDVYEKIPEYFKTKEMAEIAITANIKNVNYTPEKYLTVDLVKQAFKEGVLDLERLPDSFKIHNFTPERAEEFDKIVAAKERIEKEIDEIIENSMDSLKEWHKKLSLCMIMPFSTGGITFDYENKNFELFLGLSCNQMIDNSISHVESCETQISVGWKRDFEEFIYDIRENTILFCEINAGREIKEERARETLSQENKKSMGRR